MITLAGGAQVVLANFASLPGGELGIHLFDAPVAAGTTEVVRYESRRWRHGDSSAAAANQNTWRTAA